jgi:hypothetical protein
MGVDCKICRQSTREIHKTLKILGEEAGYQKRERETGDFKKKEYDLET